MGGGGGSFLNSLVNVLTLGMVDLSPKAPEPEPFVAPVAPAPVAQQAATTADEAVQEADDSAENAVIKKKKQMRAAYGADKTIVTGQLGDTSQANVRRKTLGGE